jgi:hypothetical protein
MSLDETERWKMVAGETTCKGVKQGNETCFGHRQCQSKMSKRKLKMSLNLGVISMVICES